MIVRRPASRRAFQNRRRRFAYIPTKVAVGGVTVDNAAPATADALIPAFRVEVAAVEAATTADAPTPVVSVSVTAVAATAAAAAEVPVLDVSVVSTIAAATASAPTPVVSVSVAAVLATATADTPYPSYSTALSATVTLTAPATANATGVAPYAQFDIFAVAWASALTPTLAFNQALSAPSATAAAVGLASSFVESSQPTVVEAVATTVALVPVPLVRLTSTLVTATAEAGVSSPMISMAAAIALTTSEAPYPDLLVDGGPVSPEATVAAASAVAAVPEVAEESVSTIAASIAIAQPSVQLQPFSAPLALATADADAASLIYNTTVTVTATADAVATAEVPRSVISILVPAVPGVITITPIGEDIEGWLIPEYGFVAYQPVVLADHPVGYWRLDESAGDFVDYSQNGHTATAHGGITYSVPSDVWHTGITLNGTTGYLSVADDDDLDLGDALTLEAWVRPDNFDDFMIVIDKGSGAYRLSIAPDGSFRLEKVGVDIVSYSSESIPLDGVAHHIVATKDGAESSLYLDGVDVTAAVTDWTLEDNALTMGIGAQLDGNPPLKFLNGDIDEVAIYPTALSAARVSAHYRAGVDVVNLAPAASGNLLVPA